MTDHHPEAPLTESSELDSLLARVARTPDDQIAPHFRGTERYRVRRRLGEGGFGVVYEVHDENVDRRLALKLLKDSSPTKVEWLKKEFRSVADLVHPNLVGLHELICENGRWFITMDLIDGVDFLTHVDGPRTSADAVTVPVPDVGHRFDRLREALLQLAEGVEAIHAAGKLHRDLKPSNVLVDARRRVVILDFGLAHDIRQSELLSVELPGGGTPEYMAPEQLRGEAASPASDWYAVGVMLYEALAGELPFRGSLAELLRAKVQSDPCPPTELDGTVPADLEELCLALLRRDPAERPSAAAILERLGAVTVPSARPVEPSDELIGRSSVLGQLEESLSTITNGQPASIFVHGEPGVGKTALCEHFLARLRGRRDALVLPARCYERESVPFKALDGVIDALAIVLRKLGRAEAAALMPRDVHLLARLFPVLESVPALKAVPKRASDAPDAQELRRRAFAALKELLGRLADKQPLVVYIDDLQWGDLDSARLLAELLGPPDPPALLFIGCYRTEAKGQSAALQALLTDASGSGREHPEIDLRGLSVDEAIELAGRLGAEGLDRARLERIARESQGHPLFLSELVREGSVERDGTASLRDVIVGRVGRLEQDARSLLEVVALAGRPVTRHVCLEAAGVGATGPDAMRLLTARHLVRTSGPRPRDWIEPYHDRVREAVVGATRAPRAREHHMALATTLERTDADPETLSEHFDAGGDAHRAGRYAAIAADAASDALAFDRAATLYQRALDRLDADRDERASLLSKLGDALTNSGRGDAAGRAFLAAAEAARGDTHDLRRRAAEQLLVSGREEEGLAVLLPLLEEVGVSYPASSGRAIARMIWNEIKLSVFGTRFREREERDVPDDVLLRLEVLGSAARGLEFHDLWRAIAFETQHAVLALKTGVPRHVGAALAGRVSSDAVLNGVSTAMDEAAARAISFAEKLGEPRALADVQRNLALAYSYGSGLWRQGAEHFEQAERILTERCVGNIRDLRYCRMKSAICYLRLGELRVLAERCDPQLREAVDRGDQLARSALQIFAKAPLFLAADQAEAARRVLGTSELPTEGVFRLYHACTLSEVHLYEGDAEAAAASWSHWWPAYEKAQLWRLPLFKIDATRCHALALVACGDAASLKRARKLARSLDADHVSSCRGSRETILACVAAHRGEVERAAELLASAADAFDEAEMKLHAASCSRALGALTDRPELVEQADAVMRSEGILRPDRWAAMYAPMPTS